MNYIELITKPVISLYDATSQGCIISGIFNKNFKKLTALVVENSNITSPIDEYQLTIKDIFSLGKDAIIIKNCDSLVVFDYDSSENINPLNLKAYSTTGETLGKITDVVLNEDFSVMKFLCENAEFNTNQIVSYNKDLILIDCSNSKICVNKFKPKQKAYSVNAHIMPYTQNEEKQQVSTIIPRANAINSELIGRTLTQNLTANNGELIAKVGSKITMSTINLAISHQKLRELSFYAK